MSEFEREERYMVIKLSKLEPTGQPDGMSREEEIYRIANFGKALVQAVVVESDWPEYEPVWEMIKARVTGAPILDHTNCHADLARIGEEIDALRLELTNARFLVDQALHLQKEHYGDGMGLHLSMITWARAAHQSTPAAKCKTCDGTGIEYDGAGHVCTACNGAPAAKDSE